MSLVIFERKIPILRMAVRVLRSERVGGELVELENIALDLVIGSKFFSISGRGNRTVSMEQSC